MFHVFLGVLIVEATADQTLGSVDGIFRILYGLQ